MKEPSNLALKKEKIKTKEEILLSMKEFAMSDEVDHYSKILRELKIKKSLFEELRLEYPNDIKEIEDIIETNISNITSEIAYKWQSSENINNQKHWLMLRGDKETYLRVIGKAFADTKELDKDSQISEVFVSNKKEDSDEEYDI